eukprot:8611097-Lingulodinium_polyedra.AAC.1
METHTWTHDRTVQLNPSGTPGGRRRARAPSRHGRARAPSRHTRLQTRAGPPRRSNAPARTNAFARPL